MFKILTFFIVLLPFTCLAQSSVSGRVVNQTDNKVVANASVFLSNATIGDRTSTSGTFMLSNIKPGKYLLVVSIVGFETYNQSLIVTSQDVQLPDIAIMPKTQMLGEVKIKPTEDKNRPQYLNWLKEEFLGASELAKECKIVNPEMLDFDYDANTGVLKASSVDFLVIKNAALGYNVKYLLSDFNLTNKAGTERKMSYKGFVLFEKMKGDAADEKRWQRNRHEVYGNSSMHFLRAVLSNKLNEEGFKVQQLSENANPERPSEDLINLKMKTFSDLKSKTAGSRDSLAFWTKKSKLPKILLKINDFALDVAEFEKRTDQLGLYALGCEQDALYITYNKNHRFDKRARIENIADPFNTANSLIEFTKPFAFFDSNGWISNPEDVLLAGVWAKKRVAELLPEDYEEGLPVNGTAKADSTLINVVAKMENFAKSQVAEKTYLQLDKHNYLQGDTIWFKAYTVAGPLHELSSLSNVLRVDLINDKDSVVRHINLPVNDGLASGDIAIPRAFKMGAYRVRAYTNWMRNYDTDGFYAQRISIGAVPFTAPPATQQMTKNPDIQFFPESGELINGLRSKVAIKAIATNGLGKDVEGTIIDNDGAEIAVFSTQHLGMGVFAFTPLAGKTYNAKLTNADGTSFTVDLPKANNEGFVLTVNNRNQDSISVKINAAKTTFDAKLHATYYLVAQSAGKVYYTVSFKLDEPVYIINVEKDRFPSGIVQFTLLAQNAEPLNERIAFIRSNDTLKLNIATPDKKFTPRQKVTFKMNAAKDAGTGVSGSFSVAVINESRAGGDENAEGTIVNNLLLTSVLKGNIELPNYYFNNITDKTVSDLDVLMLTQGYRRYEWKKVFNGAPVVIEYPAEKGLELTGSLKTPGGKALPYGKVNLFSSRENVFKDTIADINGNFIFKNLELTDTAKVVVQGRKQNDGKNVSIFIKQPDYPKINKLEPVRSGLDDPNLSAAQKAILQEKYYAYIKQQKADSLTKNNMLGEVLVKGKKAIVADKTNKYGTAEQQVVDMKKLRSPQFTSLQDGIFWVAPITHGDVLTGGHKSAADKDNPEENQGPVVIDGIIKTKDVLNSYSAQEIESVVLVYYKPDSKIPTIVVTTKRAAGTDTTVLREVKVTSTKLNKKPNLAFSSNLNGAGSADQVLMGDKLNGCISLADCLRGKLFGVIFDGSGNPLNSRNRKGMSVILNGVVLAGDALKGLNGADVYSIEVLTSASYISLYGSSMGGGALVITTNRGTQGLVTSESPTGVITYPYKGYYKARNFYSPKYDSANINSSVPDLRTTIFWNPDLITDGQGNTSFSYFNADTKGTYRVVVEGIDGNGNLGRQVYRYKVE
jgi:hypothetical protein